MDGSTTSTTTFDCACNDLRRNIKEQAHYTKQIVESVKLWTEEGQQADKGEIIANIMLAYRHLEDASMRLGKAIQAYDGGASVYDKDTTVGA